jgi:outer membrane protein assembly factor BamB
MKQKLASTIILAVLMVSAFTFLGAASASASDDWSMFRANLNHTGASSTAPATTNNVLWQFDTDIPLGSSAAVVDGKIYVGSNDGAVYCINAADGSQIWKVSLSQGYSAAISSSIAVADGKLYFGCYNGDVYCLDASTGAQVWAYTTDSSVQSSPAVVNGHVYVGSWDGNLYCLDAATGDKVWAYTTGALVDSGPQTKTCTASMLIQAQKFGVT